MDAASLVLAVSSAASIATFVSVAQKILGHARELEKQLHSSFAFTRLEPDDEYARIRVQVSTEKYLMWYKIWTEEARGHVNDAEIWGETGSSRVSLLLETIDRECRDIQGMVKEVESAQNTKRNKSSSNGWRSGLLRYWRKPKFQSRQWQDKAASLTAHIDVLCTFSDLYFQARHTHFDPDVNNNMPANILKSIVDNRNDSLALYETMQDSDLSLCLAVDSTLTDLPMDWSLEDPSEALSQTSLCFYSRSSSAAPETRKWVVSSFGQEQSKSFKTADSLVVSSFAELQQNLKENSSGLLQPIGSLTCHRVEKYSMLAPAHKEVQSLRDMLLTHENVDSNFDASTQLLLFDKFRLAYQISQFSLLHFGTAWVSHFSLDSLAAMQRDGEIQYVLKLPKNQLITSSPQKPSVYKQIFQIGVLLIELALEKRSTVETLHKLSIDDDELSQVQRLMGQQYREACQFCLSRGVRSNFETHDSEPKTNSDKHEDSEKDFIDDWSNVEANEPVDETLGLVFKQFYDEVFVRLRDLYNAASEPSSPV